MEEMVGSVVTLKPDPDGLAMLAALALLGVIAWRVMQPRAASKLPTIYRGTADVQGAASVPDALRQDYGVDWRAEV